MGALNWPHRINHFLAANQRGPSSDTVKQSSWSCILIAAGDNKRAAIIRGVKMLTSDEVNVQEEEEEVKSSSNLSADLLRNERLDELG